MCPPFEPGNRSRGPSTGERINQRGDALEDSRRLCDIALTPVLGQFVSIAEDVLRSVTCRDIDRGVVSSLGCDEMRRLPTSRIFETANLRRTTVKAGRRSTSSI